MADPKIILERTYNVPLRRGFMTAPYYRRTKKAMNVLKEFLRKHMKSENISIGASINIHMWKNGITNPPHHVSIEVTKDDTGKVVAELLGTKAKKKDEKPKKGKKVEAKAPAEKKADKIVDAEIIGEEKESAEPKPAKKAEPKKVAEPSKKTTPAQKPEPKKTAPKKPAKTK